MGAWIEMPFHQSYTGRCRASHPSWVRGLKFNVAVNRRAGFMSHPSWVRGLKYLVPPRTGFLLPRVAPFMGAWIEMSKKRNETT